MSAQHLGCGCRSCDVELPEGGEQSVLDWLPPYHTAPYFRYTRTLGRCAEEQSTIKRGLLNGFNLT